MHRPFWHLSETLSGLESQCRDLSRSLGAFLATGLPPLPRSSLRWAKHFPKKQNKIKHNYGNP
jgi:hypothetical protein